MERQVLNYQMSLTPCLSKEVQAYSKRNNVELLNGQAGLALYFLSQWVKTGQGKNLLQAQLSLKKALLGINQLYEEASFHGGPLGILWVNFLFEEQTNSKIVDSELVDKILEKYFAVQVEKNVYENHVLDFVYGVTGWFVIYPYVNTKHQKQIKDHFVDKVQKKGSRFLTERGYLGFAHGLSSILYIIKEYEIDELNEFYQENYPKIIQSEKNGRLPRTIAKEDYKRQDWCHGAIGAALLDTQNTRYLEAFFKQEIDIHSHGVCHGVGSRILVSKLIHSVFNSSYEPALNLETNFIWKDEVKFYFLESFMIAQMAIDLNLEAEFLWWRIVYPVNIE